jgi:hypothetical protein
VAVGEFPAGVASRALKQSRQLPSGRMVMVWAMRRSRADSVDLLRSVGGLLLAVGAVVLLVRKSSHHGWSDFARLLVVLVPAVVLYTLALGVPRRPRTLAPRPSESVLMVAAILLAPLALYEFLAWAGANTQHVLYNAAVFAVIGLLAGYGARRAGAPYAALLAALALLVAWLLVWGKILNHPSADAYRWLLVAGAAVLFVASAALERASAIGAGEVATAGGVAAVAAGVLGVIVGSFVAAFRSITTLVTSSGATLSSRRGSVVGTHPREHAPVDLGRLHTSGLQHFGWDLYLLVVSLALVWVGSRARVRGLGYVGGVGLLAFVLSIGAELTRLESGRAPTGSIGWPLALLIIGVAGLAAPALSRPKP